MRAVGLTNDRNSNVLAGLRIAVGIFFVIFGQYKVFGTQFTSGGGFIGYIQRYIAGRAYPFMVPVLQNFVLPHAKLFAYLVAFGEFAIGLGLVFGILTRTASIWGLLLMVAMILSSDFPGDGAAFWQYFGASLNQSIFALCFVAFICGHADRALALWPRKLSS